MTAGELQSLDCIIVAATPYQCLLLSKFTNHFISNRSGIFILTVPLEWAMAHVFQLPQLVRNIIRVREHTSWLLVLFPDRLSGSPMVQISKASHWPSLSRQPFP